MHFILKKLDYADPVSPITIIFNIELTLVKEKNIFLYYNIGIIIWFAYL